MHLLVMGYTFSVENFFAIFVLSFFPFFANLNVKENWGGGENDHLFGTLTLVLAFLLFCNKLLQHCPRPSMRMPSCTLGQSSVVIFATHHYHHHRRCSSFFLTELFSQAPEKILLSDFLRAMEQTQPSKLLL